VGQLWAESQALLTTYYNGHDLDTLGAELDALLSMLRTANDTLNSIDLDTINIDQLETSLTEVRGRVQ